MFSCDHHDAVNNMYIFFLVIKVKQLNKKTKKKKLEPTKDFYALTEILYLVINQKAVSGRS